MDIEFRDIIPPAVLGLLFVGVIGILVSLVQELKEFKKEWKRDIEREDKEDE